MPTFEGLIRQVTHDPKYKNMTLSQASHAVYKDYLLDCNARLVLWLQHDDPPSAVASEQDIAEYTELESMVDQIREEQPNMFWKVLSDAPLSKLFYEELEKPTCTRSQTSTRGPEFYRTGADYFRILLLCLFFQKL